MMKTTRREYTVVHAPDITEDDLESGRAVEMFRAAGCKVLPNASKSVQTATQVERDDLLVVG